MMHDTHDTVKLFMEAPLDCWVLLSITSYQHSRQHNQIIHVKILIVKNGPFLNGILNSIKN